MKLNAFESAIMGGLHCRNCKNWTGKLISNGRVISESGCERLLNGYWRKRCERTHALTVDVFCCELYEAE